MTESLEREGATIVWGGDRFSLKPCYDRSGNFYLRICRMTGAAEKKRARGSPHWHNVGLDLWCGTDCKKAPLEAAGIRKKDDESLAAWYFSRRDKLAELEGGSFCGVASVLYRNPFAGLVVGLAISPFRDPEAETTHMLSPPNPLKRQSWGVREDRRLSSKISHYWYSYRFRYDRDALWIAAPRKIEPKT